MNEAPFTTSDPRSPDAADSPIDWSVELQRRYGEFEAFVRGYLGPDGDLVMLRRAFEMMVDRHSAQIRQSGEPYATHPLAVARICAELRLGVPSLCAAFLHDVVEDTETSLEEIREAFNDQVAFFVEGLTKLSRIEFQSKEEHQAENLRKLIVAMTRDLRVVLIKLADRLHNIQTLGVCKPDKQRRIATETLEIYAPLAGRLGINWLKSELEDESLKYLDPIAYQNLKRLIHQKKSEREGYIEGTTQTLRTMLDNAGIAYSDVYGRPKHFYSMYRKMKRSGISFDEIHDITAFRVIVRDKATCYNVLGLVHDRWRPVAGRFKDYIAVPKGNGYQSLHTTVIGPKGERVEIQIRTHEMHETAEYGVAAHWAYKEGRMVDDSNSVALGWMNSLVESQEEINDSLEYLESIKLDLYDDEVFVFTPNGDVKALPRGSTPLDFAYAVHSEVGHHAAHARVNGRHANLRQTLENGDIVEIVTREDQHPRQEWLEIAKSSRARNKIRAFIGQEKRDRAKEIGEELLAAELRRFDVKLARALSEGKVAKAVDALKLPSVEQLYVDIGFGRLQAEYVVRQMLPQAAAAAAAAAATTAARRTTQEIVAPSRRFGERIQNYTGNLEERRAHIVGLTGDVMTSFARCCQPVPGEPIVGYVTRGRGVVIHVQDCDRLRFLEPERLLEVEWDGVSANGQHDERRVARLRIIARNQQGILAELTSAFTERRLDISEARARVRHDGMAVCTFEVVVRNAQQLYDGIRAIQKVDGVVSVDRL